MESVDAIRQRAYGIIDASRLMHVKGCEKLAKALAEKHGEDPNDAVIAAALHDITKGKKFEEQLKLCKKYGIILSSADLRCPAVLHSYTGAAAAQREFSVSARIADAISCHTTGREGMSLLDKILWVADFSEESRSFEDADKVRKLMYDDIDAAVLTGLSLTLRRLEQSGRFVHPRTAAAFDYLLLKRKAETI